MLILLCILALPSITSAACGTIKYDIGSGQQMLIDGVTFDKRKIASVNLYLSATLPTITTSLINTDLWFDNVKFGEGANGIVNTPATLNLSDYPVGTHTIKAYWEWMDRDFKSYNKLQTFNINIIDSSPLGSGSGSTTTALPKKSILSTKLWLKASPHSVRKGHVVHIIGEIRNINGMPLKKRQIYIKANGKLIKKIVTNSLGFFELKHRLSTTTNYQASFAGSEGYSASSSNFAKVIVKKEKKASKKKKKKTSGRD